MVQYVLRGTSSQTKKSKEGKLTRRHRIKPTIDPGIRGTNLLFCSKGAINNLPKAGIGLPGENNLPGLLARSVSVASPFHPDKEYNTNVVKTFPGFLGADIHPSFISIPWGLVNPGSPHIYGGLLDPQGTGNPGSPHIYGGRSNPQGSGDP